MRASFSPPHSKTFFSPSHLGPTHPIPSSANRVHVSLTLKLTFEQNIAVICPGSQTGNPGPVLVDLNILHDNPLEIFPDIN